MTTALGHSLWLSSAITPGRPSMVQTHRSSDQPSSSKAILLPSSASRPPGFFAETLRGDPPDIWIPVQQEPLIDGNGSLLHQSVSAWLRVMAGCGRELQ